MASDSVQKALRYRWIVFWILACGYVLVYFHRLCPAVVAVDMMRDLNTGGALIGFLGAAYFYPYAVMQLPAGLLSDSWGSRNTITLFFAVAFIGSVILGAAPSVFLAIVGRTLVGLGVAMLFVPTMKVLAEWFRVDEFAFMTGLLMALGGLGSLFAAGPLAMLSSWIGWRLSFIVVGVFTLVLAVLVWILVRDRPKDFGWPPPEQPKQTAAAIGLMEGVRRVVGCKAFWPIGIWFFFDCGIFFSFGGLWGGPYLMQVYGFSKAQAAQILSMIAIGMIVGSPALSYLSTNILRARKPVLVMSSIVVVGITAVLAFFTADIPLVGPYVLCLGVGIFSSAIVVIGFTTNKELFPVQMAGTATGIANLFPFLGGAVFQPLLGYVLEKNSTADGLFTLTAYQQAFGILFFAAIVAFGASLFLKESMVSEN